MEPPTSAGSRCSAPWGLRRRLTNQPGPPTWGYRRALVHRVFVGFLKDFIHSLGRARESESKRESKGPHMQGGEQREREKQGAPRGTRSSFQNREDLFCGSRGVEGAACPQ